MSWSFLANSSSLIDEPEEAEANGDASEEDEEGEVAVIEE